MNKSITQLRQKNISELRSEVGKKRTILAKEFAVTNSSKKREFKKLRELKLEIARILTIIREKEITGEKVVEPKSEGKIAKKSVKVAKAKQK